MPTRFNAEDFARAAHIARRGKLGFPYFQRSDHLKLAVADRGLHAEENDRLDVSADDLVQAVFLTSVVLHARTTIGDLRAAGFMENVVELTNILSKPIEGSDPTEFLRRIIKSQNLGAILIALCDAEDDTGLAILQLDVAKHPRCTAEDMPALRQAAASLGYSGD